MTRPKETTLENEVKTGFKEWTGKPSKQQRKILKGLGLEYKTPTGGNHASLVDRESSQYLISVSCTPRNSHGAGRGLTRDILEYMKVGGTYDRNNGYC